MAAGWQMIDGSGFYFGNDSAMRTGWQNIKGNWYLLSSRGEFVVGLV